MNGETRTGVTTFFLNHEIDKGSVIFYEETEIGIQETAGELHDRLMKMGAKLVVKTIEGIVTGKADIVDQQHIQTRGPLHGAPKIFKPDCRINWNRDAVSLFNFIRGLSPYPAAWSEIVTTRQEVSMVKIFYGRPLDSNPVEKPGTVMTDGCHFLHVVTGEGVIAIERIQLEGKKQMDITEFLRGFQAAKCRFQ